MGLNSDLQWETPGDISDTELERLANTPVRMATAEALAACTLTGNVLEANAAGAVGKFKLYVTAAPIS